MVAVKTKQTTYLILEVKKKRLRCLIFNTMALIEYLKSSSVSYLPDDECTFLFNTLVDNTVKNLFINTLLNIIKNTITRT